MTVPDASNARVESQQDVERLRRRARQLALEARLDPIAAEQVSLAVSELATNLLRHATGGRMSLTSIESADALGIQVDCSDDGPGIQSIENALRDGFSTGGSMGSGLPSARRMMDTFEIQSTPDGTHIVARKWARRAAR